MSQHDYDLANAAGAAFRADGNNALAAIVTWNSGAAGPATTFARQRWADTTNNVIKRRNSANTGWIVESTDDETRVLARSSNTMLDISDFGKTVVATGSFTQTFDAVATLTEGWNCGYRNDGTGLISFDPNGGELVDGLTSIVLYPGESCRFWNTGTGLKTTGRGSAHAEFSAYSTTGTTMTAGAFVKAGFNAEDYDNSGSFDNATNFRWVAQKDGKVDVAAILTLSAIQAAKLFAVAVYKNGAIYKQNSTYNGSGSAGEITTAIHVQGITVAATDYIEIFGFNGDSVNQNLATTAEKSHFSVAHR